MAKRLISIIIVTVASIAGLTACDSSQDTTDNTAAITEQEVAVDAEPNSSASASNIDWSTIATAEQPVQRADYSYPFALDSQNVQDYADYFKVDNATAQHNLTIGMASNEALSKVLDQLGNSYTGHELTDGTEAKLVIHTTADMTASSYDYVFEEAFAKGLVLPIEIKPDGVKSEVDPHTGS